MERFTRPLTGQFSTRKTFTRKRLCAALLTLSQAAFTQYVQAAPEGGSVVGGEGAIEQGDLSTLIRQGSGRLAINWDSFDISAEESVTFVQPDVSSIVLNRIFGNNGTYFGCSTDGPGPLS